MSTPRQLGFHFPAEWAPQSAVWLSWPSNPALWLECFDRVGPKFAEFAAAISRHEPVHINCAAHLQALARSQLNEARADLSVITLHNHPTNDVWCRDHGPLFVKNETTGEVALTDWQFRGWGGKFDAALDNEVPRLVSEALNLRRFAFDFELEGGAVETNGAGQLLATEAVLNNPNRNAGRDDSAFQDALREGLGVSQILWLGDGLANDDTDGHIDNLARFFKADGIVAAVEHNPTLPNYRPTQENLARLRALRTPTGGTFDIVELPLPAPIRYAGRDLPPSYANFLIINDAVLVPVFAQDGDDRALGILRELFPKRKVSGIDCRILLIEGGALHCLSQQQPA
ncbi:MAG: agmatine deiminase family protein [Puniceicoccales bacterium]|jgi:agmatine deiminase|nr:agmatine deiminase family protein [Puniceicoccales bacterium]